MSEIKMPADTIFSTAYQFEFLMFIIFILLFLILFFMYYFVKNHAFRDLEKFNYYFKMIGIMILMIFISIGLISQFLVFEITLNAKDASILWMMFGALDVYVYINFCFSALFTVKKAWYKYMLLILVVYIAITQVGELGFRMIFNLEVYIPFVLSQKVYESNTPNVVRFVMLNLIVLIVIYGASFALEQKKK